MEQEKKNQDFGFQRDAENDRNQSLSTSQDNSHDSAQRPQRKRMRIQRPQPRENYEQEYKSFRPEGFGTVLNGSSEQRYEQRPQRTRYQGGEYRQQRTYQQRPYKPYRQDYQDNGQRQPRQQEYQNRYNRFGEQGQGGFQPRQQAFRPRYNQQQEEGGYQMRQQGGFQPRQGFQQRNSYQPRQQYRPFKRQHTEDYDPHAKYSMKKRIEYREENYDPTEPIRLNKFLANAGICSRREADEFITSGAVTVNGEVITEMGAKVLRTDEVLFKGKPVSLEKKVYILLNKPKDYVTTNDDPQQRKTVLDLVKGACPERIYPVGRLDRNTTGVLLLTNDGELASKLTHPKFLKKKIYHVFLDRPIAQHDLDQISTGIELEDGEIHADAIEYTDEKDKSQVGIEIHSGKNRIVRRIFDSLGYRVIKLDRVQFAGLTKKNVRRGDWRFLTEKEVDMLRMGAFE